MRAALLALAASCLMSPAMSQERAIIKEVVVRAPVAAAWKAWASSEGIRSFFAPEAIVEPRPGGLYSIHFNPYAKPGMKGADGMRVLAVQENRMISFTWNAPPHLPEARAQQTVVIVRTEAQGEDRTRVRLTHLGWGEGGQWDEAFKYFEGAWSRVLANLEKSLAGQPMDWSEMLARMRAHEGQQRR